MPSVKSAAAESFSLPTAQPTGPRKRRSKKQTRWHQRWLVRIAALLLLIIAGVVIYSWKQIDNTMSELNTISTLPAQIQDQTVLESDSTPLAGLPTVAIPPTRTGPPPTVVIPNYAGVSPGGPVRQTAVAFVESGSPIVAATSTPSAPVAAAMIASPNASPVASPMATPLPITPTVIDGETQAEQLLTGGMTFDTGPAQTALAEATHRASAPTPTPSGSSYLIDRTQGSLQATPPSDGGSNDESGIIGGLRDAAGGAAVAAGIKDLKLEPMTILVMGVDARPGSAIDIGVRPDALMLLRLDPAAGSCRALAIPRDSLAELPGYGETKINHALMLGGIPYEKLVVELYTGVTIDHYALIDFTGFEDLVDAVGGVTLTVPEDLASPAVPAGTHTIDGATALQHARYRGGPDGDFGRIKRQQQIMQALIATANGKDLLREANRLLPSLKDNLRTDFSIEQLVSLAKFYQSHCSGGNLQLDTIPGEVVYGPIIDPLFGLPLSYVVSDPRDVETRVDVLMGTNPRN